MIDQSQIMYKSKRLELLEKNKRKTESQMFVFLHKLTNCIDYIMELNPGTFCLQISRNYEDSLFCHEGSQHPSLNGSMS